MAEVKVEKGQSEKTEGGQTGQSVARRNTQGWGGPSDLFSPFFGSRGFSGAFSPFALMREFTNEMDRIFGGSSRGTESTWAPSIDVRQCGGNLVVSAELPGLRKDEVKVELNDNSLIIQGERKREHQEDHKGYHRFERSYGQFYRAIPLPEGAKVDQTKADLADGVLKVTVPVPEMQKQSRQIPVGEGEKTRS